MLVHAPRRMLLTLYYFNLSWAHYRDIADAKIRQKFWFSALTACLNKKCAQTSLSKYDIGLCHFRGFNYRDNLQQVLLF